jgi:hypothetical protein
LPKSGFPKTRVSSPVAPRGVYISRIDPQKTKSGNYRKHQKSSFVDKIDTFFMHFLVLYSPHPPVCSTNIILTPGASETGGSVPELLIPLPVDSGGSDDEFQETSISYKNAWFDTLYPLEKVQPLKNIKNACMF